MPAQLGFWFLDWASDRLTDAERADLAELALTTIEVYAPLWRDDACEACPVPVGLAGHDQRGREALRRAVTSNIARPLAAHGIVLDPERLAAGVVARADGRAGLGPSRQVQRGRRGRGGRAALQASLPAASGSA
jgi:hypothetical protein